MVVPLFTAMVVVVAAAARRARRSPEPPHTNPYAPPPPRFHSATNHLLSRTPAARLRPPRRSQDYRAELDDGDDGSEGATPEEKGESEFNDQQQRR
eukprot:4550550-Prymnesium_polylepis.1